jgi:hypothetical protein
MRETLRKLFEHAGAEHGAPAAWYRSMWFVSLPAVLLSVAAIVVLLRAAP